MAAFGSSPRAEPLQPRAVLALGESVAGLRARLLELPAERLARLRAVAGASLLLVLGDEADLPWTDGVSYLGRAPDAPELLLPCAEAPSAPLPLLRGALVARLSEQGLRLPCAVVLEPPLVIPFGAALPLSREALLASAAAAPAEGAP